MNSIAIIEDLSPAIIFKSGGMSPIIDAIRAEVSAEVPDLTTSAGRSSIASNARKVAKSKVLLDKIGKELADTLNAQLKPINAERKVAREQLDVLRDEIRQPLTDWEEDQKRIEAEKLAVIEAEKLAALILTDHEIALLLNDNFDRDQVEKQRLLAVEKAEKEAQIKEAARIKAEADAQEAIDKAEREKQAAIDAVKQAKIQSDENERLRIAAVESERLTKIHAEEMKVEAEKQAKINAERAAESARLSEIKRYEDAKEDERVAQEIREADKKNIGNVRRAAKHALMIQAGITEDQAKKVVLAIHKRAIPSVQLTY